MLNNINNIMISSCNISDLIEARYYNSGHRDFFMLIIWSGCYHIFYYFQIHGKYRKKFHNNNTGPQKKKYPVLAI